MVEGWAATEEKLLQSAWMNLNWAASEFGSSGRIFESLLGVIRDVILALLPSVESMADESEKAPKVAQTVMANWIFGRLISSYTLLKAGYLSDSIILGRAAFEGLVLLAYFSRYPSKGAEWLHGEKVWQKEARDAVTDSPVLKEGYSVLSDFSHPASRDAVYLQLQKIPESQTEQAGVGIYPVRNAEDMGYIFLPLLDIANALTMQLVKLSPKACGDILGGGERFGEVLLQSVEEVSRYKKEEKPKKD